MGACSRRAVVAGLGLVTLTSALAAARGDDAPGSLCGLVTAPGRPARNASFVVILPDGSLAPGGVPLTVLPMGGQLGWVLPDGTLVYAPGFDDQEATGIVSINVSTRSAANVPLANPPGFAGEFAVGALASGGGGDTGVVGLLASTTSATAWVAVAEMSPYPGVLPVVRANLSAVVAALFGISPGAQAYDAAARTLFFVGCCGGASGFADVVLAVPLDVPGPAPASLRNLTVPDGFWLVGLAWAASTQRLVAVGTNGDSPLDGTVVMLSADVDTGVWALLASFGSDAFLLDVQGVIAVDGTGALVSISASDTTTDEAVVVTVDATTGVEAGRRRLVAGSRAVALVDCGAFSRSTDEAEAEAAATGSDAPRRTPPPPPVRRRY